LLIEPGGWDRLRLGWRLLRDPRVAPRARWMVPAGVVLYLVSPLDLVPDVLLGIGQLDDLGVIGLLVLVLTQILPRIAPADVVAEHIAAMDPRGSGSGRTTADGAPVIDATFRVRDQ